MRHAASTIVHFSPLWVATVHQHCVVFTEFIQDLGPCKLDFQLVWEHSGGIQDFPKEGGGVLWVELWSCRINGALPKMLQFEN